MKGKEWPGVQSMLVSLQIGAAPEGKALVFDHFAGEIGEDWSQSSKSFDLCHLSDG